MPVWRSSDSPASWTLLKEGAEEKKGEKIGHVSHNLCSVNFPAHASTVYRVLRISNLPLLFSAPPLPPPTHLSNHNPSFTFHPPPSLFVAYVILIFSPVFFVSLVGMLSLGVAKFTSLHMTNTNKEANKSNMRWREKEGEKEQLWMFISLRTYMHRMKSHYTDSRVVIFSVTLM